MRNALDSLVTEKVLAHINDFSGCDFDDVDLPGLKNVCAKVSPVLSDDIDRVSNFLGISKRRFLEAAFIHAVEVASEIMKREGLSEAFSQFEGSKPSSHKKESTS